MFKVPQHKLQVPERFATYLWQVSAIALGKAQVQSLSHHMANNAKSCSADALPLTLRLLYRVQKIATLHLRLECSLQAMPSMPCRKSGANTVQHRQHFDLLMS